MNYSHTPGLHVSSRPTNSIGSESHCTGSLTIAHEDESQNVGYLNLEGRRTHYPNIRRGFPIIRSRTISHVELSGNCCWELYSHHKFRGHKQTVFPGEDLTYPDFQPISLRKLECHEQ